MSVDPTNTLLEQMEKLGDVFITIRAELAQSVLSFSELLNLEAGTVIPLSRPTGENIDVYAEDVLIGWGEVLVMEEAMTVRIADLRNAVLPGLNEKEEAASGRGPNQKEQKADG